MSFPYEPLVDNAAYIRLVTILSAGQDEQPRLELTRHLLSSSLAYTALSYEWGPPQDAEHILLDGRSFVIRRNLRACLKHLQQTTAARTPMFIDAICIDQSNVTERNAQVQVMADIYKYAKEVIVWLGPAAEGSDILLDSCNADDAQWSAQTDDSNGHDFVSISTFELANSLDVLLSRSYWSRLWIIQELYFAQSAIFLCGSRRFTLPTLRRLCNVAVSIWGRHDVRITDRWDSGGFEHLRQLVSMRRNTTPAGSHELYLQILRLQHCKCSEIKDKVYGLLGMHLDWIPSEERSAVLKVDYDAPVELLWARVVNSMNPHVDVSAALELLDVFKITSDDLATLYDADSDAPDRQSELQRMTFSIELLYVGIAQTSSLDGMTVDGSNEDDLQIRTLSALGEQGSLFAQKRPQEWQRLQRCVCLVREACPDETTSYWIAGTHLVVMLSHDGVAEPVHVGVLADTSQESGVMLAATTAGGLGTINLVEMDTLRAEGVLTCAVWVNVDWNTFIAVLSSCSRDRPETLEYMALDSSGGSSPSLVSPYDSVESGST